MNKFNNFVYYQPNKKDIKDEYGDATIRAISKAMGWDWVTTFDALVPYARENQCMMYEKPCYENFLKDNGFVYHGISNRKGSKRPVLHKFAKEHKDETIIAIIARYKVCCKYGNYHDTVDFIGDNKLYGYWIKDER